MDLLQDRLNHNYHIHYYHLVFLHNLHSLSYHHWVHHTDLNNLNYYHWVRHINQNMLNHYHHIHHTDHLLSFLPRFQHNPEYSHLNYHYYNAWNSQRWDLLQYRLNHNYHIHYYLSLIHI